MPSSRRQDGPTPVPQHVIDGLASGELDDNLIRSARIHSTSGDWDRFSRRSPPTSTAADDYHLLHSPAVPLIA